MEFEEKLTFQNWL